MCQFLESICAINGEILNLEYHQKRVNRTFKEHFVNFSPLNLRELLKNFNNFNNKTKIRFLYSKNSHSIETEKYFEKKIERVKIVVDNEIDYSFKSANRDKINEHIARNKDYDDVIIVKNNLVTDSSYANLVFFDGKNWLTPKSPLLNGTKRDSLLTKKLIYEKEISVEKVKSYSHFMLINALLDFNTNRTISTNNIF